MNKIEIKYVIHRIRINLFMKFTSIVINLARFETIYFRTSYDYVVDGAKTGFTCFRVRACGTIDIRRDNKFLF